MIFLIYEIVNKKQQIKKKTHINKDTDNRIVVTRGKRGDNRRKRLKGVKYMVMAGD